MSPFINCKYEAIYNVLKSFGKDITLLDYLCYFKLQKNDEILYVYPKIKLLLKSFLKYTKFKKLQQVKLQILQNI